MKCKDCEYWRNYEYQIVACISGAVTSRVRNSVILRPCSFKHSPNIDTGFTQHYTDENYECHDGIPKKED